MSTLPVTSDPIRVRSAELGAGAAVLGLLALVPGMPVAVRGVFVAVFVLLGPGAAALAHLSVPMSTRALAVPCVGLVTVVVATWASTETIRLSPTFVMIVLAVATLACAAPLTRPVLRWRS